MMIFPKMRLRQAVTNYFQTTIFAFLGELTRLCASTRFCAWLTRRQKVTNLEIGEAALELQHLQQDEPGTARVRRRGLQARQGQMQSLQQRFQQAQQRLATYEQAETLLEECVDDTTVGERLLVEYYLTLEELVQDSLQAGESESSARMQVLFDVQQRVERMSISEEDE